MKKHTGVSHPFLFLTITILFLGYPAISPGEEHVDGMPPVHFLLGVNSQTPLPTCDDGLKNQDETGVDCGGSCGPCLNVSLNISERYGVNRTEAPVTFGVPIALDANIRNISSLGITDHDAQFRVLSRYNDTPGGEGPIRMVLVDLQETVAANQTNTVTLTSTGSGPLQGRYLVSDDTTHYTIATGVVTAQISKTTGNIFENVELNSSTLISAPANDKWVVVYNSTEYFSHPTACSIEENGPLRSVIKVDGEFRDINNNKLTPPQASDGEIPDSPLRYTIRYFAYKDKGYIRLQATLKNENKGWQDDGSDVIHNAYISESYLQTTLSGLGVNKNVSFDGYTDSTVSDTYQLIQQETSDGSAQTYSWEYQLKKNSSVVTSGTQYDSYANLSDGVNGLMVADRWFWQNHPTGITISGNQVRFNLWPDMAQDYRILGAIWKTRDLLYYFHPDDNDFIDELAHLKSKLILKSSDTYLASTGFFWGMAPKEIITNYRFPAAESLDLVFAEHGKLSQAAMDNSFITHPRLPHSILDIREARAVEGPATPDPTYATWYGWLHFGAMPRGRAGYGYHNQHFDWGFWALLNFLRFDSWKSYDFAQELLQHKTDILVLHDPDARDDDMYFTHGGQRSELDALFSLHEDKVSSWVNKPTTCTHFWTKDLSMQYLLTGEHLYLESAMQGYDHVVRIKDNSNMLSSETRSPFRGIDALVTGYQLTGLTSYLDTAWEIWKENLAPREGGNCTDFEDATTCTSNNSSGFIQNGEPDSKYHIGVGGDAWMVEPLLKLYFTLENNSSNDRAESLGGFLKRWSTFVKDELLPTVPEQGTYDAELANYTPFAANNYWRSGEPPQYVSNVFNTIYLQPYADLLAWRYVESGDSEWLNLAHNLFKDATWYVKQETQPVIYTADGGIGLWNMNSSSISAGGKFKTPKSFTKPMYYMRVTAGLEEK